VLLSIVFALTGCLPKTAGQEPPIPVVSIKAYLPDETPDDATIYIVGSYCDWSPDNAATSTVKTEDGQKYAEFELQVTEFPLKYKYTIGPSWNYVEKDAEGNEIGDRVIESAPEGVVIDTVAKWAAIPTPPSEEPTIVNIKAYLPENTPDYATIYIVGNYCGWDEGWTSGDAATSKVKIDTENKKYAEFELEISQFPLEYKYTVGPNWEYVEVKADGNDLDDNRKIDSAPEGVVIDTVAKWAAIPTPPSEEEIIIDGNFSDWESYEGTKKILEDSANDSKWGDENDVNWLGIAADEEFLYIGAQYKASNNGFIVYISKENDTTGATDMNFPGWQRAIKFDRNVQYFVATWEYQDPQLWQVVNESTKVPLQEGIQEKFVNQGIGYEVKIPLSQLGLEPGDKIYFVGCIVGGDGASSPDTIPDNDYPDGWDWNVPINITNMAELLIP
ncbi:MAG TPA: hypothetical protein PKI14_18530, partial [Fervidobacterium sp.]|nr:hypothetical protein [Fervidobacterium sp.]